jgi:hypothetical protein
MMFPVEVRYLNISWSDKDTVSKIEASLDAVDVENTSFGGQIETTTYPKNDYTYIGFRIGDAIVDHTPYFILNGDARQELVPWRKPGTQEVWWIAGGSWDARRKVYNSDLFNRAGRFELIIQQQKLLIQNQTLNFTISELEYYLTDFKNTLWMLILDTNSSAKGRIEKTVPDIFDDAALALFFDFVESVENVLKKPGMVLKETQEILPRRSVRPVPRTFREFITRPTAKALASRAYFESYDTPENRFIHYCVKRVSYILSSLSRIAAAQCSAYTTRIEQEKEWMERFGQATTKRVDARVYDNEIAKLERDLQQLSRDLNSLALNQQQISYPAGHKSGSYVIQLGKLYGNSSSSFFVEKLDGKKHHDPYLVAKFPEDFEISGFQKLLMDSELEVTGRYLKSIERTQAGKKYYQLEFLQVKSVALQNHSFQRQIRQLTDGRKKLELGNWLSPMTGEEIQGRDMQNRMAVQKIRSLEKSKTKMSKISEAYPGLIKRLRTVELFFTEHSIKSQSHCTHSMVFVQNPTYAAARRFHSKISNLNGLDETVLNSLMTVEEIGLRDLPNLYESWCLLQIIRVLTEVFGFEPDKVWQSALINAVLKVKQPKDVEINLKAPDFQQRIVLTYEKVLASGKRPDFVIDLFSGHDRQSGYFPAQTDVARLVLDAKFRGELTEAELQKLVSDLYKEKNYAEDGKNQVFIIHPVADVIDSPTSPLAWGGACDYGQSHQINHRHGGIFLSPSLKHFGTRDNLQRLIGMFLQQNSVTELIEPRNSLQKDCRSNLSCISCGNTTRGSLEISHSQTQAGNDKWDIKCKGCGLLSKKTMCVLCKQTLFKNGPQWTYHRTRAEQMSNVVCPKCETFL